MNLKKMLFTTSLALAFTSPSLYAVGEDEVASVRTLQMSVANEASSSSSTISPSNTLPHTEGEIRAHFKAEQGKKFKAVLQNNECLPSTQRTTEIFEKVWEHEARRRELQLEAVSQCYIFGIGPDCEAQTENRPFSLPRNQGYDPAIVAALGELLEGNNPKSLLEVGPAFGINELVLLEKHPNLRITAMDLYQNHVDGLNGMAKFKGLQERLTASVGRFPDPMLGPDNDGTFDVVVFSKVLSFYDNAQIEDMLRIAAKKLKPGGSILLTTSSFHTSNAVWAQQKIASWCGSIGIYWGGPYGVWPLNYGFCNFLKTDQIGAMATQLGLETTACDYVGTPNVNWAASNSGWFGISVDQKRARLFAHLKKSTDK